MKTLVFILLAVAISTEGVTTVRKSTRVTGGKEASPHQFPFMVGLFVNDGRFCSGSILRDNVVLTAASCCDRAESIEVVAGAHKIKERESTQQRVGSSKLVIHESWNRADLSNDICLVFLSTPLSFDRAVVPTRLYDGDGSLEEHAANLVGWGKDGDTSTEISPVLNYVAENILTREDCEVFYDGIEDYNLCLDGWNFRSGCSGDAGSALLVYHNNQVQQAGFGSFVSDLGCELGHPTGFTNVAYFRDWINEKINAYSN